MLIREKTPAIAILRTMGARASMVEQVFLVQGVIIALAGIAMGLVLGTGAALHIDAMVAGLESLTGVSFLEGTYFVEIPVQIEVADLGIIALLSTFICLLAAWIPARRARKVHPVLGLHGV
jgi:lipoprotein-releasing system permease protein